MRPFRAALRGRLFGTGVGIGAPEEGCSAGVDATCTMGYML
jgi:hypothetical protein